MKLLFTKTLIALLVLQFTGLTTLNNNRRILKKDNKQSEVPVSVPEQNQSITEKNETELIPIKKYNSGKNNKIKTLFYFPSIQKEGHIGTIDKNHDDNPFDNVFHVEINRELTGNETVYLEYELTGVQNYISVSRSINEQLAIGGYFVKKTEKLSKQKEQIPVSDLKQGDNVIRFTIPDGGNYNYTIKNPGISIEKNVNTESERRIIINCPTDSYAENNTVYIRGFLTGKDCKQAKVYADDTEIKTFSGNFEDIVQAKKKEGNTVALKLKAVFPDGEEITSNLLLNKKADYDYIINNEEQIEYAEDYLIKDKAFTLNLSGAKLLAEPNVLKENKKLSITALRSMDVMTLDAGMVNVTKNHQAYRFLPQGTKFEKELKIELEYDSVKIPSGYTEEDIKTYYFDEQTHHWIAVPRDTIDKENHIIISRTNHFTDYINGIIKVPESPETAGYTPTTMQGIKAANPNTGINLISPPSANSTGSAGISYPIVIPAGRQGLQPSLGIQYNSGGGNGWMGLGWDMSVPSITVDTRWGVPRYDAAKESETYTMGGDQLSPISFRSEWVDRTSEKRFYPRTEGAFNKIIRHGDSPTNYWWEVTDKSGTKYFYGGTPETGKLNDAVLTDANGNIAHWALTEIRDLNTNFVRYHYSTVTDEASNGKIAAGKNLYIEEITYTGHNGVEGKYKVLFTRDRELGEAKRKDININARYGFKQGTADLLRKVEVLFQDEPVRSYEFNYIEGAFYKTLLSSVTEFDSEGTEFYSHEFEYYKDFQEHGSKFFTNDVEIWNTQYDSIQENLKISEDKFSPAASALSGNNTWNVGGGLYIGVGTGFNVFSKSLTLGGNFGFSHSESGGKNLLVDIDGDGLPDKLLKKGDDVYYRPQIADNSINLKFGDKIKITGLTKFLKEKSNSFSLGTQANAGKAFVGISGSYSRSKTTVYFADVNGDGLLDIINEHTILYNHIDGNGHPDFFASSSGTPNPINESGMVNPDIYAPDPDEITTAEDQNPLHDVVKMWIAPYEGIVNIQAPITLVEDTSSDRQNYTSADGIIATFQHNEEELWRMQIDADDYLQKLMPINFRHVNRGDKLFFRVNSVVNGAYDQVTWNPVITYVQNHHDGYSDADNKDYYKFNSKKDWVLTGKQSTGAPIDGKIKIDGVFKKPVTSDNITVVVVTMTETNGILLPNIVLVKNYAWDEIAEENLESEFNIQKNRDVRFYIITRSNIDWSSVEWTPHIYYTKSYDPDITQVTDASGNPTIEAWSVPQMTLYSATNQVPEMWSAEDTVNVKIEPQLKMNLFFTGNLFFTVKQKHKLISSDTLHVKNGKLQDTLSISTTLYENDSLFVSYNYPDEISSSNFKEANYILTASYSDTTITDTLKAGAFSYINIEDDIFGELYRGWGQFVYNSNNGRADAPIDLNLLELDDSFENPDDPEEIDDPEELENSNVNKPDETVFIAMYPDALNKRYAGYDDLTYIAKDTVSSSRMGEDDIKPFDPFSGHSGVRVLNKLSRSYNLSVSGGAVISANVNTGWDKVLVDFSDMNGDRYPDIISKGKIQYTKPDGSLPENNVVEFSDLLYPDHRTAYTTIGGNFSGGNTETWEAPANNSKCDAYIVKTDGTSTSIGGSFGWNKANETYLDINGDGLPDKLLKDGTAYLNLGYAFDNTGGEAANQWAFEKIGSGYNFDVTGGTGFSFLNNSFQGGIGLSASKATSTSAFIDINGDGLADYIYKALADSVQIENIDLIKVYCALNTGNGFDAPVEIGEINNFSRTTATNASANVSFTFGFTWGAAKIVMTPSINGGVGISRSSIEISDIDGDGFPDYLQSSRDDSIMVKRSVIGRTNMLKKVNQPLGGYFTMDYEQVGNTYDLPQAVWVLSKVETYDGFPGDGADRMLSSFEYENGKYDRHERTFLGFAKVKQHQHDTENNDALYRTSVSNYKNDNIYQKGMLLSSYLEDAQGHKYTETENIPALLDPTDGTEIENPNFVDNSLERAFPVITETITKVYEGQDEAGKSSRTTFEYDGFGNISKFTSYGEEDKPEDNYSALITYHKILDKNITGIPKRIIVTETDENGNENGNTFRDRETSIDNNTGKITQIRIYQKTGTFAKTDMEYDTYGNLNKITYPNNLHNQRMFYNYVYDETLHTYPISVTDAFGYGSSSEYEYKFGQVLKTVDLNGQEMHYEIDRLGRITDILGPYELEAGLPYTIHFDYHPFATVPYAHTKHYDPAHPGNDMETVIFTDGFGRVLQTKKDVSIFQDVGQADIEKMTVSGKIIYDAFGRTIKGYYPITENKGNEDNFNNGIDNIAPTVNTYDVADRVLTSTLPDGAVIINEYGFGTDRNGNNQLMTKVTDPNGISSYSFTDANGRQTANKGALETWVSFSYNAIGELLEVKDPNENITYSEYDNFGRRTKRIQPDAGTTEYDYDLVGNLTTLTTANLAEQNKHIQYDYEYNRLKNVSYPLYPQNDVNYLYGEPGAEHNRAGRLVLQQDATGVQEFFYGKLGEMLKQKRTIVIPEGDILNFTTQWEYDTWNRVTKMTYPDGEELTYNYNLGGLLHSMSGEKKGYEYNYVTQLGYDKFENRVYLSYGNGTETTYNYDAQRLWLKGMNAKTASGRDMMLNAYTYDLVGNILKYKNNAPVPTPNLKGGPFEYNYQYDNLYRLTHAEGTYTGSTHTHAYTLDMSYDLVGNILNKNQYHKRRSNDDFDWVEQHGTTHNFEYLYEGTQPNTATHIGEHSYTYDADGSMILREHDQKNEKRQIVYDEENRMLALADNGKTSHNIYDGAGERIIKSHGDGQVVFVNGKPAGGSGTVGNFTVYASPYLVVQNLKYTKHFYIGSQRIVSKLGEAGSNIQNDTTFAGAWSILGDYDKLKGNIKDLIIAAFYELGLEGEVLPAGKSGKIPFGQIKKYLNNYDENGEEPNPDDQYERNQYYFHPDHLGSTSYLTDASGEVYQHLEYLPFGETLVEEHYNSDKNPYLYNGKELDEETGLYYYGARFYDAQIGRFYLVDRYAEKYYSYNSYHYTLNNPINAIDVNGDWVRVRVKRKAREELKKQGTNIEGYLKGMFSNEYGISINVKKGKFGYKVESINNQDGYDSKNGISKPSGLKVSETARNGWMKALNPNKKSKGSIVFKTGTGSNAGIFGGFARIHLNEVDDILSGELPLRTFNMARIIEHEYLSHVINNTKDPSRGDNISTGGAVDQVNKYREEMGLPIRSKYTAKKIVDKVNQTIIYRLNFNSNGNIKHLDIKGKFLPRLDGGI